MRRTAMTLMITAVMTLTMSIHNPPNAAADHKRGPCHAIHWRHPKGQSIQGAVADLIRCAARRWSVPGGAEKALSVARCESGLWPWAVGGDNLGVMQHKARYWRGRALMYLRPAWDVRPGRVSAFNAYANVIVSIRMAHRGGWGPWEHGSCA